MSLNYCQQCYCVIVTDHCMTCGMQNGVKHLDYNEIAELAFDSVLHTLVKNDGKHGDSWKARADHDDVEHATDHLIAYLTTDDMEDLDHAMTRIALMKARRKK